eukprot:gene18671-22242_t
MGQLRNSAKALVRCCLSPARRLLRQRHDTMNHQPTLLRYLDGWPRRTGRPSAFLIQFVEDGDSLARFAHPVPATRAK